jgi:hypothetical protein
VLVASRRERVNVALLCGVLERHFRTTFDAFAFFDVDDSNILGARPHACTHVA